MVSKSSIASSSLLRRTCSYSARTFGTVLRLTLASRSSKWTTFQIESWTTFQMLFTTYVYLSSIIYLSAHARPFLIYNYTRTRTRTFLCLIAYFALLPQNTPKNSDFLTRLFSVYYKKSAFFLAFFCKNIWSYQKKAVPLHSLLRNKCVSIFYRKARTLKFRFSLRT